MLRDHGGTWGSRPGNLELGKLNLSFLQRGDDLEDFSLCELPSGSIWLVESMLLAGCFLGKPLPNLNVIQKLAGTDSVALA